MLKQHLQNPRLLTVLLLGFSSALPLALTSSTLQAWFTEAGVSLAAIGALSLVGMPYLWKFLWAPLMDRFIPPCLGRRRGWIAITQLSLCITLLILANFNPTTEARTMGILAVIIAFLSASQDIAFDAYRTDILLPRERGIGSAYLMLGLRIALLFSGGLALIFADHIGWRLTYELMAVCMGIAIIPTLLAPDNPAIQPPKNFIAAVTEPFQDLWHKESIIGILLFIILYKIGDALALSLMSNFLLRHLGFSLTDVGVAYKTVGLFATIIGAFVGGLCLMRLSLYRGLLYFGILQALSHLMFMWLAVAGKNYPLMVSSLFIENFCSGMSSAALLAFLMSLCHPKYSATQYAFFSALAALGRVLIGPLAALMVERLGWVTFYGWSFFICFPAILLLVAIRTQVNLNQEVLVSS